MGCVEEGFKSFDEDMGVWDELLLLGEAASSA
jgi:hypothetical protein